MRISGSSVEMSAQRVAFEKTEKKEDVRFWVGDRRPDFEGSGAGGQGLLDQVSISPEALSAASAQKAAPAGDSDDDSALDHDLKYLILQAFLEQVLGKKLVLKQFAAGDASAGEEIARAEREASAQAAAAQRAGWGVEIDSTVEHYESESVTVSASGVINTADGREVKFGFEVNLSREFYDKSEMHVRLGDAKLVDPLVINFTGDAAAVKDTKFRFDIDSDGSTELISELAGGNGFLAMDRDGDGKITSGGELFGPTSGDGFAELAKGDSDGNGWIDSNDPIYDKLRIWSRDESGRSKLLALGQAGVGAIWLSKIGSSFDYKDANNATAAKLRASGLYVSEDGSVGAVQQVDMAV